MCKFYNLNVPERRSGEGGNQNHGGGDDEDRHDRGPAGDEATAVHVPPHEHKLEYSYWMWFSRRPPARDVSASTTGYGQVSKPQVELTDLTVAGSDKIALP